MEKYLYKKTPALKEYYLNVDGPHQLYIAHYGNPHKPVVFFLHGGPGAASEDLCSCFFNPRQYHIIVFDQRGCGKSVPQGELYHNETKYLIQDIETIRVFNKFQKIILFGGSWGASLSLLYAISYPHNVSYYIIRGLCLMDDPNGEVFTYSMKLMYPELWEPYINLVQEKSPLERAKKYFREIKKGNQKFIDTWFNIEFKTLTPNQSDNHNSFSNNSEEKRIVSLLESYYYSNQFFIPPGYLLKHTRKISHIPGIIIHGRLDVICSLEDSYRISKKLPKAKLQIIEGAGHSYYDPLITKAMVEATRNLIKKINS